MTDMTAEKALEWLHTIAAISTAVASDRPLSFSYQEAVKFQAAVKALTAPRVPEGWRDFVAEVVESAEGYESRSGNKVNGDWVARGRVLLTAAPAPADVTLIDEGDIVQVSDSNEIATLLERVKVLEGLLAESKKVMKADNLHRGNPARRDLWQRITKALTVKSAACAEVQMSDIRFNFVQQPTPNTCVLACLSMVTGAPVSDLVGRFGDKTQPVVAAGCWDCGAIGPDVELKDSPTGYAEAITAWNRRAEKEEG